LFENQSPDPHSHRLHESESGNYYDGQYEQDCIMTKIDRLAGAETISARAREIGTENGVTITDCIWDIGQSVELQHAHRLDICTDGKSVRLYFPDLELSTSGDNGRQKRTENRLRDAIAQLTPRSPSRTYATSN
jgi:hypothetical protein